MKPLISLLPTVLGALFMLGLCSQPQGGFMLIFFAVPLFLWAAFNFRKRMKSVQDRTTILTRAGIWCAAMLLVVACHTYYFITARTAAQRLADKIESFERSHGRFPESVEAVGENAKLLRQDWMLGYSLIDGEPFLAYAVTYSIFEMYHYDFQHNRWIHGGN